MTNNRKEAERTKQTKFTWHIRHRIDAFLSKGTISLIILLAAITLTIIIIAGFSVIFTEKEWASNSLLNAIWKSFTLTLDPGNLASVEGSVGLIFIAAIMTLSGIFITSTLIGIINTGLSTRLDDLKHGRSRIIEHNHTVILGYNESVFSILAELQIANENKRNNCIVLMGNADKQAMEDQIIKHIPKSKGTRIICRNGDICCSNDLERCSIETCRSIIINQTDDMQVIKTLLAVSNYLKNAEMASMYQDSKHIHVTASINDEANFHVARIAGNDYAEVLYSRQLISRIIAHICYQPGLSSVYQELFDFSGDEIYIEQFPSLIGYSFHDVQLAFRKSIVIGVKHGEKCILNPNPELVLSEGDRLILIAKDDGISQPEESISRIQQDRFKNNRERYKRIAADNLLILGSNDLLPNILDELDVFLPSGSQVTLALDSSNNNGYIEEKIQPFDHLMLETQRIKMTNRHDLENIITERYKHILILSDNSLPVQSADAKALAILLHIRDIVAKNNLQFGITSELLDVRNQELAQGTNVTDFVIGSKITSLIIAQVAENRLLADVFCELLQSAGSEFYLKPANHYIPVGQSVNLFTVAHAVSLRNEVFIGYKQNVGEPTGKTETRIITNPDKSIEVTFSDEDWLIVLAED